MLIHHINDFKFLIQLPKYNFRNKRNECKPNDKIVTIKLNHNRKHNFKDKKLKEIASINLEKKMIKKKEILTDYPQDSITNTHSHKENYHEKIIKKSLLYRVDFSL